IEQIKRPMSLELRQAIIDGAYWLRRPGPNCQVVVAYTGTVAPEAIQAVGLMAEDRRDVGLLAVTSADRLNAGWTAASRAGERGRGGGGGGGGGRPPSRQQPQGAAAGGGAAPLRHRDRARWASGDARVAGSRVRPPGALAGGRALRPDGENSRPLPPLRHRL